jgi:hypothetical protein
MGGKVMIIPHKNANEMGCWSVSLLKNYSIYNYYYRSILMIERREKTA